MTSKSLPACTLDEKCYRNDGHAGAHAYANLDDAKRAKTERAPIDEALGAALRLTYFDVFHDKDIDLVLDFLGERGYTVVPVDRLKQSAQVRVAATEVVRLGNQPGMDDDEWETAMSNLEVALFPSLGELNEAISPFRVRIRSANCTANDHGECLGVVEQDEAAEHIGGFTDCLCACHVGDDMPATASVNG